MPRVPGGRIPALILSGGRLKRFSDAEEYRVWVHPKSGDDFYFVATTPLNALRIAASLKSSGKYSRVEKPLAVVWDAAEHNFREVVVPWSRYPAIKRAALKNLC